MATVTVTPPSVVKVEVGNKPTNVQSINYGSRTLRGASDLVFSSPATGDVIAYNATTGNFEVVPAAVAITDINGGYF